MFSGKEHPVETRLKIKMRSKLFSRQFIQELGFSVNVYPFLVLPNQVLLSKDKLGQLIATVNFSLKGYGMRIVQRVSC